MEFFLSSWFRFTRTFKAYYTPFPPAMEVRLCVWGRGRNHRLAAIPRVIVSAEGKPPFGTGQDVWFFANRLRGDLREGEPFLFSDQNPRCRTERFFANHELTCFASLARECHGLRVRVTQLQPPVVGRD